MKNFKLKYVKSFAKIPHDAYDVINTSFSIVCLFIKELVK